MAAKGSKLRGQKADPAPWPRILPVDALRSVQSHDHARVGRGRPMGCGPAPAAAGNLVKGQVVIQLCRLADSKGSRRFPAAG